MTKYLVMFLFALIGTAALAAGEPAAAASVITPGFSMAIASGLCGYAQGKAIQSACEGIARNPGAAGNIRTTMIIGLALIESLALYTLVILFAI
ncbi:MAG: F0F1 ATP synthase subunit C [Acidobacteria bacterium]|nr:MAG: F0F1 ATP synthase subunit C [Acidobacteriota bacterium]PIE89213.1 MAG: F0F1 ATP synthase subunit C [Acidobacteriota bacterium]